MPIGCVIVRDLEVIATAGNQTLADRDPTAHAEILAIRRAAELIGSERLTDCDLYVTLEPCTMCAAAISFARIRRLYYGAPDPKGGAVDSGVRFFASPTCHHAPEVYSAVGESVSAALLRNFSGQGDDVTTSFRDGARAPDLRCALRIGESRDSQVRNRAPYFDASYRPGMTNLKTTTPGKTRAASSPSPPDSLP